MKPGIFGVQQRGKLADSDLRLKFCCMSSKELDKSERPLSVKLSVKWRVQAQLARTRRTPLKLAHYSLTLRNRPHLPGRNPRQPSGRQSPQAGQQAHPRTTPEAFQRGNDDDLWPKRHWLKFPCCKRVVNGFLILTRWFTGCFCLELWPSSNAPWLPPQFLPSLRHSFCVWLS